MKLGVAGAAKTRSYSIASAPRDPELEFCIELFPGGALTPSLFSLRPGAPLILGTPKGRFVLDASARLHLMIATGTGIAPLRSMLRDALREGAGASGSRFVVVHGASYADELPYFAELRALAASDARLTYVPTVSRPTESRNAGWQGARGRADAVALELASTLAASPEARAYACGHPLMVKSVSRELAARGWRVASEAFD